MERVRVDADLPQSLLRKNLDGEIKSMEDLLKAEIAAIHGAFEDAIESYRQIDDLVPEEPYGPTTNKVA